jgi:hypothetical protein
MSDSTPIVAQATRVSQEASPEEFVTIWQTSESAEEAAERCSQLTGAAVSVVALAKRATAYRRAGVALKKMPKS